MFKKSKFSVKNYIRELKDYLTNKKTKISVEDLYIYMIKDIDSLLSAYLPYLNYVLSSKVGQITIDTQLGSQMSHLLSENNLTFLEFGAWNGLGSTILAANSTKAQVYSVELNPFMVSTCIKNLQPFPKNLNILFGKFLSDSHLIHLDLSTTFLSSEFENDDIFLGALIEIILLNSAPSITNLIPQKVDMILLDGGGIITLNEFYAIEKICAKYLCLDDINSVKCVEIYDILKKSINYHELITCSDRDACIFEKLD